MHDELAITQVTVMGLLTGVIATKKRGMMDIALHRNINDKT